jgi:hypothetical protein
VYLEERGKNFTEDTVSWIYCLSWESCQLVLENCCVVATNLKHRKLIVGQIVKKDVNHSNETRKRLS